MTTYPYPVDPNMRTALLNLKWYTVNEWSLNSQKFQWAPSFPQPEDRLGYWIMTPQDVENLKQLVLLDHPFSP